MTVRKRKDRWEVRVRVGEGRRIEKTLPPGASKQEALAYEASIRRARIDHVVGKPRTYTISEVLDRWVETEARTLKSWQRDLRYRVEGLKQLAAGRKLGEIVDVADGIKRRGLAAGRTPATVNRYVALLRRAGNLAERWGWTAEPLGRRVQLLPEHSRRDVYLTEAEVRKLAKAADPLTADIIWFAVLTGLRRSEILALKPEQVRGDVLALDAKTKSGRPRGIPLTPRALRIARKRLPWGIPYWDLRKRFDAARAAAGLDHVHFHDLRHTFASFLAQAGQPMGAIRDLMGHSSLSVTNRYAHLAPAHLREAIASLPGGGRLGAGRVRSRQKKRPESSVSA